MEKPFFRVLQQIRKFPCSDQRPEKRNERNEGDQKSRHLAGALWEPLVTSLPELLVLPPTGGVVEGKGPSRGPVVVGLILSLLAKPHG